MKASKLIATLALACMAAGSYAQSCAGHAKTDKGQDGMSMVTKELNLNADQQAAFQNAMASCEKDCRALAVADTKPELIAARKSDRFDQALSSMKTVLTEEQYDKLQGMNHKGELAGLCAENGKGCCAGKTGGKAGCCAGGHAEKANTGATPTIQ